MDLPTVHTVPAFSLVYTRAEIHRNFRILRIPEKNERESVGKQPRIEADRASAALRNQATDSSFQLNTVFMSLTDRLRGWTGAETYRASPESSSEW